MFTFRRKRQIDAYADAITIEEDIQGQIEDYREILKTTDTELLQEWIKQAIGYIKSIRKPSEISNEDGSECWKRRKLMLTNYQRIRWTVILKLYVRELEYRGIIYDFDFGW